MWKEKVTSPFVDQLLPHSQKVTHMCETNEYDDSNKAKKVMGSIQNIQDVGNTEKGLNGHPYGNLSYSNLNQIFKEALLDIGENDYFNQPSKGQPG